MSLTLVKDICGWVGSAISMFFYISPIVPMRKVMKGEMKLSEFPGALLLMSLMNCLLWTVYGIFLNEIPSWLSNGIGAATTLIWLILYWIYFAESKWLQALIYNFIMLNFIVEIFYLCYAVAGEKYFEVVGYVAMVFNILMYAAPGEKIYQVIMTNNYDLIPVFSVIAGVCSSTFWGVFGIILGKVSIIVPNVLGVIFSILQIIVWCIYRIKKTKEIAKPILMDDKANDVSKNTSDIKA